MRLSVSASLIHLSPQPTLVPLTFFNTSGTLYHVPSTIVHYLVFTLLFIVQALRSWKYGSHTKPRLQRGAASAEAQAFNASVGAGARSEYASERRCLSISIRAAWRASQPDLGLGTITARWSFPSRGRWKVSTLYFSKTEGK
jgi:hypothetical protein